MRVSGMVGVIIAVVGVLLVISACGKSNPQTSHAPNQSVTYDRGADFTGVIRSIDDKSMTITFYAPLSESEETYLYTGGSEILSKNDIDRSMSELEPGEVYDVYLDDIGTSVAKMKETSDIIVEEDVHISVDSELGLLTVDDINYRYSKNLVSLSDGKKIDPMEVTSQDRVTFRGVKGMAYSVVVTGGHGYLEFSDYKDFIGGTLTVDGEAVLPVSEGMLLTLPEGKQRITMKNGSLKSEASVKIKRGSLEKLSMKEHITNKPNVARVTFKVNPVGADLYINGALRDYTKPISLNYGAHSLKVVLEGYNSYTGTLTIKDPTPTIRIDLAEESAQIESDSTSSKSSKKSSVADTGVDSSSADYDTDHKVTVSAPVGAAVYINGTYKGVAPCTFTKMVGSVTLTLTKEGYTTKSYSIEIIDDGEDITISFPDLIKKS